MSKLTDANEHKYLQYLLENLFADKNYGISIQDTSGVLHSIPWLQIEYPKYKIHTGPLCTAAKSTSKGLSYCARMKAISLNRFKENSTASVCRCHMGLTEVAKPVYQGTKLACALYIGSFIPKGQKQDVINRVNKYSTIFGTQMDVLQKSVEDTPELEPSEIENLLNLAETLAKYIELLLEKSHVKLKETNKKNRVNKSTSEGVHWAVAFTYEYVDFNFRKSITLKNIAKQLFLNPDYLCRLFHKHTGLNFIDYLNGKRINEARRILSQSKVTITEVCYDVGFNNKAYFNRVFKNICGITPSEYKKSQHQQP